MAHLGPLRVHALMAAERDMATMKTSQCRHTGQAQLDRGLTRIADEDVVGAQTIEQLGRMQSQICDRRVCPGRPLTRQLPAQVIPDSASVEDR